MKRLFFLILAVFCVFSGIYAIKKLPAETGDLIEKKYDTWSGVLRVWIYEGSGAAGWLNRCAAEAEKKLNGVYIHIQEVPLEAITGYAETGINPPDIIVYPDDAQINAAHLTPIFRIYPLRAGLTADGVSVPLLLRPRFWIYDSGAYAALPGDMYYMRAACRSGDLNALVALCTGLRPSEGSAEILPGLDLGLTADAEPTPGPTGDTACRISPELMISESPRELFRSGEADVFVGGVADALLLGDGTEWAAAVTGDYICADSVMFSIVEKGDRRTDACMEYLDVLMDSGQTQLARAQAFPAVTGASAWSGNIMLAAAEAALEGRIWLTGANGTSAAAQRYIEGTISADEAMRRIISAG